MKKALILFLKLFTIVITVSVIVLADAYLNKLYVILIAFTFGYLHSEIYEYISKKQNH